MLCSACFIFILTCELDIQMSSGRPQDLAQNPARHGKDTTMLLHICRTAMQPMSEYRIHRCIAMIQHLPSPFYPLSGSANLFRHQHIALHKQHWVYTVVAYKSGALHDCELVIPGLRMCFITLPSWLRLHFASTT